MKDIPSHSALTIAGTGTPGYSGDGGLAIYAQLGSVLGAAADTAGNVV